MALMGAGTAWVLARIHSAFEQQPESKGAAA
jgi:hypothetical protein